MMLTTDQWIPLDGLHELPLVEALQREQRGFMKPLKYDARTAAAFPNVLLLDCGKVPLPLYVVSPFAEARERVLKEKAIATSGVLTWVWYTDKEMPPLPPARKVARAGPVKIRGPRKMRTGLQAHTARKWRRTEVIGASDRL